MNITVYCGSGSGKSPVYAEAAREVGTWIAQNGHTLVYGGGRLGLMNTVAGAAKENGGKVIGVIPDFLDKEEGHRYDLDELIRVESMSERKKKMLELGDAFLALPGGAGTLDEIAQVVSLISIDKLHDACIFYNKESYYEPLRSMFDRMQAEGFMTAEQRKKFQFCWTMDEISEALPKKSYLNTAEKPKLTAGEKAVNSIARAVDFLKDGAVGSELLKAGRTAAQKAGVLPESHISLDTRFGTLMENEKARAFIQKHIPERAQKYLLNPLLKNLTLRQVLTHMPGLSDEKKKALVQQLEKIMK